MPSSPGLNLEFGMRNQELGIGLRPHPSALRAATFPFRGRWQPEGLTDEVVTPLSSADAINGVPTERVDRRGPFSLRSDALGEGKAAALMYAVGTPFMASGKVEIGFDLIRLNA